MSSTKKYKSRYILWLTDRDNAYCSFHGTSLDRAVYEWQVLTAEDAVQMALSFFHSLAGGVLKVPGVPVVGDILATVLESFEFSGFAVVFDGAGHVNTTFVVGFGMGGFQVSDVCGKRKNPPKSG